MRWLCGSNAKWVKVCKMYNTEISEKETKQRISLRNAILDSDREEGSGARKI